MPLDSEHDIRVFNNGKKEMINIISKEIIPILYKHINDINIRNDIMKDLIKKIPDCKKHFKSLLS